MVVRHVEGSQLPIQLGVPVDLQSSNMVLQRSGRLLHHVQNICLAGARMHSASPIISMIPVQQQRTKRQTQFSTSAVRRSQTDVVRAAPEIDFEKFASMPARIVPRSPAYFSGSPQYIDHRLKLEALLAKYKSLPTVPASEAPRMAWFKLEQFRNFIGERVPTKKYKDIIKILQRLSRIQPALLPDEVRDVLQQYLRRGNPYANKPSPGVVDEFGRARGKGKRKTSNAVVYLVEGNGEVLINNRNIVDIFPRVHDRESALWALRCTQRLDKYNVWARVWGGGTTGQAEAISLALARALLIHEPALKPVLRRAGVITVDPRRVERKKPGHVKARKMPTWVKR